MHRKLLEIPDSGRRLIPAGNGRIFGAALPQNPNVRRKSTQELSPVPVAGANLDLFQWIKDIQLRDHQAAEVIDEPGVMNDDGIKPPASPRSSC